ncbi:MAG: ABC transporter permease [Alphaproteobacteria bacterium]|nr:MAG: ABC transporter permease [Alphaproteobacteria bacterium]
MSVGTDDIVKSPLPLGGNALTRIWAMVLRYWYLTRSSGPRILELAYWPTVQMSIWGFIQTFLAQQSSYFAQALGVLLGAVMLWDVLLRGQLGLSITFFEEVWSRNLGHLMVSPLRPIELIAALMTTSLIKTLIGLVPTSFLAMWFFGFNIYGIGLALVAFFFNLILFGWGVGLIVSGLVLRYGQGAESLAWALTFALAPLCGVYYPVSVLPEFLQVFSYVLPPAYIFEGMRNIVVEHRLDMSLLIKASLLNVTLISGAAALFYRFLRSAEVRGTLLQIGE